MNALQPAETELPKRGPAPSPRDEVGRHRPWGAWLRDLILAALFGLVILGAGGVYYTDPYSIVTASMEPTLNVGETVWATRLYETPDRGEIVAFRSWEATKSNVVLIKRVVGLPGERIEAVNGKVLVDFGELNEKVWSDGIGVTENFGPILIGDGEYFLLGDNRPQSLDSRHFGPVSGSEIDYVVRQ